MQILKIGKNLKRAVLLGAATVIYLLAIMGYVVSIVPTSEGNLGLLGVLHPIVFLVTVFPVIMFYLKRGYWFNLTNFMSILIYIYLGFGSLYYVTFFHDLDHESLRYPNSALKTFGLICLAAFVFRLGSIAPFVANVARAMPVRISTPEFGFRIKTGILVSVGITLLIKGYMIASGQFGVTGDGFGSETGSQSIGVFYTLFKYIEQVGVIAGSVGFYYWFSGAKLNRLIKQALISFVGVLSFIAVMSGMKAQLLHVILMVIIPAVLVGVKQKRVLVRSRTYLIVLALFISFWVISPFYRAIMVNDTQSSSVFSAAVNTVDSLGKGAALVSESMGGESFVIKQIDVVWSRVSLFRYLNSVVAQTPAEIDYRGWERYPYLPFAFIPRAVLPGKPRNDYSAQFNVDYIAPIYNSTTPTTVGWAYMEGGIMAIVILMFALGFFHGVIDRYTFVNCQLSIYGVTLFGAIFIKFANLEPDPFWLFSGIIHEIFILALAYMLIFMRVSFNKSNERVIA
jgi:hypothetical protein